MSHFQMGVFFCMQHTMAFIGSVGGIFYFCINGSLLVFYFYLCRIRYGGHLLDDWRWNDSYDNRRHSSSFLESQCGNPLFCWQQSRWVYLLSSPEFIIPAIIQVHRASSFVELLVFADNDHLSTLFYAKGFLGELILPSWQCERVERQGRKVGKVIVHSR